MFGFWFRRRMQSRISDFKGISGKFSLGRHGDRLLSNRLVSDGLGGDGLGGDMFGYRRWFWLRSDMRADIRLG